MQIEHQIELMAPAGDRAALSAALRAGADSVYFGVGKLNMRARSAGNFTIEDLPFIAKSCHTAGAKAYLTLNTVIFDNELIEVKQTLNACVQAGIDAVIASDLAVIELANECGISVHLSVQCNISNYSSLKHYASLADVAVLARELSLEQIVEISSQIKRNHLKGKKGKLFKIELFAHGALCVAFSGKCNMSLGYYGVEGAANRGVCNQPCRRKYQVTDVDTGMAFSMEGDYVMSPKDLCTISYLDQLLDAGVSVLKIEGRGRSPEYVSEVTSLYKAGIVAWQQEQFDNFIATQKPLESLKKVFNRGFWEGGYYLGRKEGDWCKTPGNAAEENKQHVGEITKYFSKLGVAECHIKAQSVKKGDELWIIGNTTGAMRILLDKLCVGDSGEERNSANKGEYFSFEVPVKVRKNDKVYLICKNEMIEKESLC